MTERAAPPAPGTQRWVSLMVHDLEASQRFYQALFGWEYQAGPQRLGPYVRALRDGRPVAGLGQIPPGERRLVAWLPYIATQNADATATRIRDCGGTVAVGPLDFSGGGRLAIAADLHGAPFGLWQGGGRGPLPDADGVPVWNELVTAEAWPVSMFYVTALGYEVAPDPSVPEDVDYLLLRLGDHSVAGVRGVGDALPHDRGAHWLPYFSARDPDATAERARKLGAQVQREPENGWLGRTVWLSDPEGAPFAVLRPSRPLRRGEDR